MARNDEAAFQKAVVQAARLYGWRLMHVSDSRREVVDRKRGVSFLVGDELTKGWPDLALAHPKHRVFAVRELKTDHGRETLEQANWLQTLTVCGVDTGVWRPRDWDAHVIPFLRNPRIYRKAKP